MAALIAALAVALGVLTQTATGFGFSLLAAPFLIAAYQAPTGVQIAVVLSVFVNLAVLARQHRGADWRAASLLLVPAVVAALPIGYVVGRSDPDTATLIAGVVCLVAVAGMVGGRRFRVLESRAGTVAVGVVSGGMNVMASMSGPPAVLYAVNAGWPLERARPTLQLHFLGLNIVTVASLGWPDRMPLPVLAGFAAGAVAGVLLAGRVPDTLARPATLVLAAVGSLLAIARGLTG